LATNEKFAKQLKFLHSH